MSDPDPAAALSEALAQIGDLMTPIVEAVAGYKAQAVKLGFGESVAEDMAVQYHRVLVEIVSRNLKS